MGRGGTEAREEGMRKSNSGNGGQKTVSEILWGSEGGIGDKD